MTILVDFFCLPIFRTQFFEVLALKSIHESYLRQLHAIDFAPGVVRRRIYAPYQGIAVIVISDWVPWIFVDDWKSPGKVDSFPCKKWHIPSRNPWSHFECNGEMKIMNLYVCQGCFRGPQFFLPLLKGSGFLGVQPKDPWGINGGVSALGALLKVGNPWVSSWWKKHRQIMQSARVVYLNYKGSRRYNGITLLL